MTLSSLFGMSFSNVYDYYYFTHLSFISAKYQPYDALRQHFWRQYLTQYDTDDTKTMSHLELTSMLDSLGSTLTRSTVSSFFTRFGKNPYHDDLTIPQAIQCLEAELGRPDSEKKRLDLDEDSSFSATPVLSLADDRGQELKLDQLDFSGPSVAVPNDDEVGSKTTHQYLHVAGTTILENSDSWSSDAEGDLSSATPSPIGTPPQGTTVEMKKKSRFRRTKKADKAKDNQNSNDESSSNASDSLERVINVKSCPLCHRPRLNSKAEIDIITHLAVCASQDWKQVDRIVVGNFVTASQAQRKWYTKVISKVSSGDYKLGAVCFFFLFFFAPCCIYSKKKTCFVELCQYYCSEPNHRSVGGGKDASLC